MTKYTYTLLSLLLLQFCAPATKVEQAAPRPFNEQYRPQYHFSPPAQWMNDPNGMVYFAGEYHLFYQHYPDGNTWGPMHWGHAVSSDMVHWQHLPIALYPDSLGFIFSGSALIDWENTSGFGTASNPPMVAIFTYHSDALGQTQGIAYSLDSGRTFVKYDQNPVLPNPGIPDFRDPKVFWMESQSKWVMILAVKDHVNLYSSPDLKQWTLESEFGHTLGAHGGVWECPDLFELTDEQGVARWVMLVSINPGGPQGGSATQYFVGDFDGKVFTPQDTVTRWVDYGADNYAGVTWADIPQTDGKKRFIGWMSNWQYAQVVPTQVWRSASTLPRALSLTGSTLVSSPAAEVSSLRAGPLAFETGKKEWPLATGTVELTLAVDPQATRTEWIFASAQKDTLRIVLTDGDVSIDRTLAGQVDFHEAFGAVHAAPLVKKATQVTVFIDRSSIELFVNGGEVVMTDLLFPRAEWSAMALQSDAEGHGLSGYALQSIWDNQPTK